MDVLPGRTDEQLQPAAPGNRRGLVVSIDTSPQTIRGDATLLTPCASCSGRISPTAEAATLGDLSFHSACVPSCDECGQSLGPALEQNWTYQVMVVPSVYGYECLPFHHLCPDCREATMTIEPSAQD